MNVRGAVPDGWWKDKEGALRRLVEQIAAQPWSEDEWVVVIADGRPLADLPAGTRGQTELRYAGHSARDAADDDIVALVQSVLGTDGSVDQTGSITVVTSDRGLIDRLPPAVTVEGARTFRHRLGG